MSRPPVAFCVHSFNEADGLRRLVRSSYPFANLFQEWVIVDHRSDDDTADAIAELASELEARGITLHTAREERDLSREHTFADVRNLTLGLATQPIAVLMDADFILGEAFGVLLQRGVAALTAQGSPYYGASFTVPCLWDELETDQRGKVVKHGRLWVHQVRPRILWRSAIHYEQTGDGGRWERLTFDDPSRQQAYALTQNRRGALTPHTLVSVNVKSPERIALRDTMTMFMQDAMQGVVSGSWMENYRAGTVRNQPPYPYQRGTVRGWRLHCPNLRLASGSSTSV